MKPARGSDSDASTSASGQLVWGEPLPGYTSLGSPAAATPQLQPSGAPCAALKPVGTIQKQQQPSACLPAAADDEGSSGDEGAPRAGETFAGPQAGRGMGSKVKAAALELLEGGWGAGGGGGCWEVGAGKRVLFVMGGARACRPGQSTCTRPAPAQLGTFGCTPPTARVPCPPAPATPVGGGEGAAPAKGLFALPFMQRALERKRLEAQQAAQAVGAGLHALMPAAAHEDPACLNASIRQLPQQQSCAMWGIESLAHQPILPPCPNNPQALEELEGGGRQAGPAGGAAGRLAFTGTGVDQRAQVRFACVPRSFPAASLLWRVAGQYRQAGLPRPKRAQPACPSWTPCRRPAVFCPTSRHPQAWPASLALSRFNRLDLPRSGSAWLGWRRLP